MYLLFDIGGTNTRLAVSNNSKKIIKAVNIKTAADFDQAMQDFKLQADKLLQKFPAKKAVGGVPGPLNKNKSALIKAPNLPEWINKPLQKKLIKILNCPVNLENDADLAGLGEAVYGAGRHYQICAYFTISTGIGGSRIVNKKIDANALGFEPGHQIIDYKAGLGRQTLENNVSGSYLQEKYHKQAKNIKDKKIWQQQAQVLSAGLNNAVVFWSPQIIILGGSLMKSIRITEIKKYLKNNLDIFPNLPVIKKSELNDKAGLYGGLALIK